MNQIKFDNLHHGLVNPIRNRMNGNSVTKSSTNNRLLRDVTSSLTPVNNSKNTIPSRRGKDDTRPSGEISSFIRKVSVPVPIQMPMEEYNLQRSATAQSFCSTSKIQYLPIKQSSDCRPSPYSQSCRQLGKRAVSICGERYTVSRISPFLYSQTPAPYTAATSTRTFNGPRSAQISSGYSPRTPTSLSRVHYHRQPQNEQVTRFMEGFKARERTRVLKRTSEVLPHRVDRFYYMTGATLRVSPRYHVGDVDILKLERLRESSGGPTRTSTRLSIVSTEEFRKNDIEKLQLKDSERSQVKENTFERGEIFYSTNNTDRKNDEEEEKTSEKEVVKDHENKSKAVAYPAHEYTSTECHKQISSMFSTYMMHVCENRSTEFDSSVEQDVSCKVMNAESNLEGKDDDAVEEEMRITTNSVDDANEITDHIVEKRKYTAVVPAPTVSSEDFGKGVDEKVEQEDDDEDDNEDLTEDEMIKMLYDGELKLDFDRSIFKGMKYTPELDQTPDKRAQFREVTKHLVASQETSTGFNEEELEIIYVDQIFSEELSAGFLRLFDLLDSDKNGKIVIEDLRSKFFTHLKIKDIPFFFRVFDLNRDKTIDQREFLAVAALNDKLCDQTSTNPCEHWNVDLKKLSYYITVYKEMFQALDCNNDGRVSLEELMIIVAASLNEKTGTNVEIMKDIMISIDRDGSGYIEFVEYLTYIPFFIKLHNRLLKKPMLVEDCERARFMVKLALATKRKASDSLDMH